MLKHKPVLLSETLELLNIKSDGIYVDCTLGGAGHSEKILEKLTTGKLYCLEQDKQAIIYAKVILNKFHNYEIIATNFRHLKKELQLRNILQVDGIIYDLGVSSPQLDEAERGFSYHQDGPLDMRMDQKQTLSAEVIVNNWSFEDIVNILWIYGEEKFARTIARAIVKYRENSKIITTLQLVDIVKSALPMKILKKAKHPARKTFQALRIAVNDELDSLRVSLKQSLQLLKSKGVLVVISFHSLEDRIVKTLFKEQVVSKIDPLLSKLPMSIKWDPIFELLTKKVVSPCEQEIQENSRARSAKLRAIIKF
ncbi:16S rRNA (cytosine(1402)-N(4))-methyltransferase RsmH [Spiroplasma endosymbiont of 'Nebria riversi']|uniref:16S rRNA (cytosine(1402)-N(4))-methyltransferase RsmH n=1 Tax=Spiroplasma endosymbiont of 'Nebria riversi' TaxID=2792084 RepID=UPI001C056B58|nr:16S rRNA (cytosine(1402)-N(4))-methyltransferase RsmH [Spiroplasma endosymbiont of 'Nebria riversi']